MSKRISARVSDDLEALVVRWCERLGMTKAQMAGLAIRIGLRQLLMLVEPEAVDKERFAELLAEVE